MVIFNLILDTIKLIDFLFVFIYTEHMKGVIESTYGMQLCGATKSATSAFPEKYPPYS